MKPAILHNECALGGSKNIMPNGAKCLSIRKTSTSCCTCHARNDRKKGGK